MEQARPDRAPVGDSRLVDCAVLMDEPHLLAHDVIKDQSSGFEAEWMSLARDTEATFGQGAEAAL